VAKAVAKSALATPAPPRFGKVRESTYAYAYIFPAFFFIAFATLIGVAWTVWISLTNYSGLSVEAFNHPSFVGLRNYRDVLFDVELDTFLAVLRWTFAFAFLSMAISFAVGLALALLLNDRNIRERSVYRTILIIPWALPGAVAVLSWNGILNTDFGYLNSLLEQIGLPRVGWLTDPFWARSAVVGVNVWFSFPFMMTACLGALQAVPDELHEAARIDGAGPVARFRYVTSPVLRSVVAPLLIGNFAFQFGNFTFVYLLTAGRPASETSEAGATDTLLTYGYKLTLEQSRYAVAAAYGVILFLIIGVLSLIAMKKSGAFAEAT